MRTDCRHYESRTYGSGDVVRKCRLDMAPEAPWRCPDDCVGFERRTYDAGWQIGSLTKSVEPPAPEPAGDDVAALLDAAEEIVNSAAPDIMQDVSKPKRRFGKRKKKR
jgi:hypothetical protein